ncbi:hypothetical protein TD95_004508 [Thielaviopsis punctulata]|uniref:Uncharacterized protein n=1 Tax=Thielaviopsis punctulata TaxID=72032 RepID=A0A0F4ZHR9_9PEZI|nr:hypothetical protein TD95_004508 [Thielaviopsis punctulata]
MLPPIDEAVLERHPDFAAVYATLTTAVLNPDGTTKAPPDPVEEDLDFHRTNHARRSLLAAHLSTLPLPADLALLPALLSTPIPDPLLSTLLSTLPALDPILPALSAALVASATHVARLTGSSSIPAIPPALHALHARLATAHTSLLDARHRAAASLATVLAARAQALAHLVRAVEAKHGAVARSAENRAAEMALEAQRLEAETRLALGRVNRKDGSRETAVALANYASHLRDARVRLEEAVRSRRMEGAEYGVGVKGQEGRVEVLRGLADEYRDVVKKMDDVEQDLKRLRR